MCLFQKVYKQNSDSNSHFYSMEYLNNVKCTSESIKMIETELNESYIISSQKTTRRLKEEGYIRSAGEQTHTERV